MGIQCYFHSINNQNQMQEVTSTQFQQDKTTDNKAVPPPPADPTHPPGSESKLNQNFYQRTRTTIYMLIGYFLILAAGQFYSAALCMIMNFMVFNEITNIKRNEEKQVNIPMTKYINWYVFVVVNYFCLGNFISSKQPILGVWYPIIGQLLHYHSFICFCLFIVGFLCFVLSLKQGYLKYQFRLFGWIVMAALLIILPAWCLVHNIYEGMIWYIIPCMLIICNDIFAYIFGYFLGKHQLIALSPKKTWEGYLGGAVSTVLFSIILTEGLQSISGITCPMIKPSIYPFSYPECESTVLNTYNLGFMTITELQFHMMIFSLFASTIGPFGGFFASGLKRAIKIKDFANLIPGHGGVSDRMDCQIIMGVFVYFYYSTFVKSGTITASSYIISLLSTSEQLSLYQALKIQLTQQGLI